MLFFQMSEALLFCSRGGTEARIIFNAILAANLLRASAPPRDTFTALRAGATA